MQEMGGGVHECSLRQMMEQTILFSFAFSVQRLYPKGLGPFSNCICSTLGGI